MSLCRLAVHVGPPADNTGAIGHVVFVGDRPPRYSGLTSAAARALGFGCLPGQVLALVDAEGPVLVLIGGGMRDEADPVLVRRAAASFAEAVPGQEHLGFVLPPITDGIDAAASAALEGVAEVRNHPVIDPEEFGDQEQDLILICDEADRPQAVLGVERGCVLVRAARWSRELGAAAEGAFTADLLGGLAGNLGAAHGFTVEVARCARLPELGDCDLTGLAIGRDEVPLVIRLTHRPGGPVGRRLRLLCRAVFQSGAAAAGELTGACALMAAMAALRDLHCATEVTGYVLCTAGPCGEAALLTHEEQSAALLGAARLTGAALRRLGPDLVAVLGAAPERSPQIAGALCLERLVDGVPWGHLDLAGTPPPDLEAALRSHGTAGLGLLLLIDLALGARRLTRS